MTIENTVRVGLSDESIEKLGALLIAKSEDKESTIDESKEVRLQLRLVKQGLQVSRRLLHATTIIPISEDIRNELSKALYEQFGMSEATIDKEKKELVISMLRAAEGKGTNPNYCLFMIDDGMSLQGLLSRQELASQFTNKGMYNAAQLNIDLSEQQVLALKDLSTDVLFNDLDIDYSDDYMFVGPIPINVRVLKPNKLIFGGVGIYNEVVIDIPVIQCDIIVAALKSGRVLILDAELDEVRNVLILEVVANDDLITEYSLDRKDEKWDFTINLGKKMDFVVKLDR